MKSAILRLVRILVAQLVSWVVLEWGGITLPYIPITIGALINAAAKFLRDKYGWDWLPI